MLYFYSIAGARDFMIIQTAVQCVLMVVMSIVSLLLFQLLLGNPLQNFLKFMGIVCLGGLSLSLVFTFLAAIAARAQQNAAMMAILGFPLIIPQILLLMRFPTLLLPMCCRRAVADRIVIDRAGYTCNCVAVILFPFLWKD